MEKKDISKIDDGKMTLNEYQKKAMSTCMPSSNNFSYMMLNLVGEVGEFASKVAKMIRKEQAVINENDLYVHEENVTKEYLESLVAEVGDIAWQLFGLCSVMGLESEFVAWMNLEKLSSRKERGKIDGEGDDR